MENNFTFWLKFESLGMTDWYQTAEWIGFDGAEFTMEQNGKRYSRDIVYCDIDKVTFVDEKGKKIENSQVINPEGDTSFYLDYALEWHFATIKEFGFQSIVKAEIRNNGVSLRTFTLDYSVKDLTDGYSYVNCMLLDDNNIAEFKRNLDTTFNALGTKDVKDNTITPIPTFNYLRRATPQFGRTIFRLPNVILSPAGSGNRYNNFSQSVEISNIESTLGWLTPSTNSLSNALQNIRLFKFKNDSDNIQVKIDCDIKIDYRVTLGNPASKVYMRLYYFYYDTYTSVGASNLTQVFYQEVTGASNQIVSLPNTINFNVPAIARSNYLGVIWELFWETEHLQSGNRTSFNFYKQNIEVTATQTAIDVVIKASKYIDLIKQSSKFINGLQVNAPLFDVGGVHENQAVFCRNMITQNTLFYTNPKDVLESVNEVNCDYEINESELYVGRQNDYYVNQEIGQFLFNPDIESNSQFNERLMINNLKYGYSKYAQDREINGSKESIHTDSEWIVPNTQVENKKEVNNKFVRDGRYIQDVINTEIRKPTTSTESDNEVLIEEYVSLPPNSFGTFGDRLYMNWTALNTTPFTNVLEILNRDSNGDAENVNFSWTNIGLSVGDTFEITQGENVATYEILSFTSTILKLRNTSLVATYFGDAFIKVKYRYSGVFFQTRYSEGFSLPSGKLLPNINYSIKRNLKYFYGYLASCMLYAKTKIRNTYFRSNGTFESQLLTESTPLIENADVNYTDFGTPIIGTQVYDLNLVADYIDIYNFLQTYKTTKGFVRCIDNVDNIIKGFVQKLAYNWLTSELKLTIEEVYEPEILTLIKNDNVINVNGFDYDYGFFKFQNDYLKIYDNKNKPIFNFIKYNLVNLNGITYSNRLDLENALLTL